MNIRITILLLTTVLIIGLIVVASQSAYTRQYDTNYVDSRVAPGKDSNDGTILYIGKYNNINDAEKAASAYKHYSWHSYELPSTHPYIGMLYVTNTTPVITKTIHSRGIISGSRA